MDNYQQKQNFSSNKKKPPEIGRRIFLNSLLQFRL